MTGFINVYKREGETSAFAVNRVKRLTGTPCGHMGTLDPLACGVLPVGVGKATRLFDYFLAKKKVYAARFRFGCTTETLDREGTPVPCGRVPDEEEIRAVLGQFVGEIDQIPPKYSAKNVNGRRGYELARAGEEFSLPPKRVRIDRVSLTGRTAPDEFSFEIECGGGTYIRSLARDIAAACGTFAYMSYLKRERSGVFTVETAVPLEKLDEKNIGEYLIRTENVLPFPVLKDVDPRVFHGVACACGLPDGQYKLYEGEAFYGIARVAGGLVKAEYKLC